MSLGTYDEFTRRLEDAEKYGFDRDFFPWSYNGHDVVLMDNDGYLDQDGRLLVKFTLFCRECRHESAYRGKLDNTSRVEGELHTVKLLALFEYNRHEC